MKNKIFLKFVYLSHDLKKRKQTIKCDWKFFIPHLIFIYACVNMS